MAVYYLSGCPCCSCCGTLVIEALSYYEDDEQDVDYLYLDFIGDWTWFSEDLETARTERYVHVTSRLSGIPATLPKAGPMPQTITSTVIADITYTIDCGTVTLAAGTHIYWDYNAQINKYIMRPVLVCA